MPAEMGIAVEHRVEVQCFGILEQICGGRTRDVAVTSLPASVADILERLALDVPAVRGYLAHTACAIGDQVVRRDAQLQDGEVLVLLPPVSGG